MPALPIPVVDISQDDAKTGAHLVDALSSAGFAYIKGQGLGIDSRLLDGAFQLSQQFFCSPIEEKRACSIQANNIGWSPMHSETLDPKHQRRGDFKEALNLGEFSNGKAQQPLPPSLASHEAELNRFGVLCHDLCIKLVRLIARGLKIGPDDEGENWFASRHDPSQGPSGSVLRLLHYPTVAMEGSDLNTAMDIRAGAHSDYGSLTLLFQRNSQPGLQVLTPDKCWSPVPVSPPGTEDDPFPPILVNIGDLMHFWTNSFLKSTVHRVVFPEGESEDRYSIAYFCHPLDHIKIEPVPSEMIKQRNGADVQEDSALWTAEQYLQNRLAATYDWGKEQSIGSD